MEDWVRTVSSANKEGEVTDVEDSTTNQHPPLPSKLAVARRTSGSDSFTATTEANEPVVTTAATAAAASAGTSNLVVAEDEVDDDDGDIEEDDDDDEDEYEYEDDDDAAFSGFLVDNNPAFAAAAAASVTTTAESKDASPATIEEEPAAPPAFASASAAAVAPASKWRQPSKEAVSMSLRAEKEKSGGKRRLAQDLYRIMNQDTKEAGFSLKPSSEDCMDKWTIKLFQFDEDSNLAKDMKVLGLEDIELEMKFPDQYPFEPPFVRVMRPRFKRQTGFVMNGALCMELLTSDGWNPINDIESVIVSIRSLLVVGDGRLEAAYNLSETKYNALLSEASPTKKQKTDNDTQRRLIRDQGGSYTVSEAQAAYSHLSDYHKKKGWDTSGWWARKG